MEPGSRGLAGPQAGHAEDWRCFTGQSRICLVRLSDEGESESYVLAVVTNALPGQRSTSDLPGCGIASLPTRALLGTAGSDHVATACPQRPLSPRPQEDEPL